MARPKKAAKTAAKSKPAFRTKAEAAGWADQMEAQVKGKQREESAELRAEIAAARAFAAG